MNIEGAPTQPGDIVAVIDRGVRYGPFLAIVPTTLRDRVPRWLLAYQSNPGMSLTVAVTRACSNQHALDREG